MNLELVKYWIEERERIRKLKEAGKPSPWTNDQILAENRFCNVRREDDKVTRWIKKYIREPFMHDENLWFMLCIARVINWPPTLQALISTKHAWPKGNVWSTTEFIKVMRARSVYGKVFTSAYVITAPQEQGTAKADFVATVTLGELWRNRKQIRLTGNSLRYAHGVLKEYPSWGDFMAYQAVIDMRYTEILNRAQDINTWAAAGPGTVRGLNRVFGRPFAGALSQNNALLELKYIHPLICQAVGMSFELSEITGIMCEFDKYMRVKNGEGKLRAGYAPFKQASLL